MRLGILLAVHVDWLSKVDLLGCCPRILHGKAPGGIGLMLNPLSALGVDG